MKAISCHHVVFALLLAAPSLHAIMAGGETDLPADTPSARLDTTGQFSFVGALSISNGSQAFKGSAVALSRDWVLTAGHNADLNDDGLVDPGWSASLNLPGLGIFGVAYAVINPNFTGFGNPSINDDLALFRLTTPLPETLVFPTFSSGVGIGSAVTLVGFGRSGYGSYGYTTQASLTDRRFGENVIDSFSMDDEGGGFGEVFRYDFDAPSTTGQAHGSLGNPFETIIGPGDSGGPALLQLGASWDVVGINTFTEGYGGRFGDTGGGVLVAPYRDWIVQTTGIPEPSTWLLVLMSLGLAISVRRGRSLLQRAKSWQKGSLFDSAAEPILTCKEVG
jgi:Trypsin